MNSNVVSAVLVLIFAAGLATREFMSSLVLSFRTLKYTQYETSVNEYISIVLSLVVDVVLALCLSLIFLGDDLASAHMFMPALFLVLMSSSLIKCGLELSSSDTTKYSVMLITDLLINIFYIVILFFFFLVTFNTVNISEIVDAQGRYVYGIPMWTSVRYIYFYIPFLIFTSLNRERSYNNECLSYINKIKKIIKIYVFILFSLIFFYGGFSSLPFVDSVFVGSYIELKLFAVSVVKVLIAFFLLSWTRRGLQHIREVNRIKIKLTMLILSIMTGLIHIISLRQF